MSKVKHFAHFEFVYDVLKVNLSFLKTKSELKHLLKNDQQRGLRIGLNVTHSQRGQNWFESKFKVCLR